MEPEKKHSLTAVQEIHHSFSQLFDRFTKEVEEMVEREAKIEQILPRLTQGKGAVKLNVGGREFCTLRSTLEGLKDTYFVAMLNHLDQQHHDFNNSVTIDRNPKHFEFILDFLRHRPDLPTADPISCSLLIMALQSFNVRELLEILLEAKYYEISSLSSLVHLQLWCRFNTMAAHHSLQFNALSTTVKRSAMMAGQQTSATLCGSSEEQCPRYVEIQVNISPTANVMFGVMPKGGPLIPYPGCPSVNGLSYYGTNGQTYRGGTPSGFGPAYGIGDRVGLGLVQHEGKLAVYYYKNGQRVGARIDIPDEWLPVVVVVNLHTAGEEVEILQAPKIPADLEAYFRA